MCEAMARPTAPKRFCCAFLFPLISDLWLAPMHLLLQPDLFVNHPLLFKGHANFRNQGKHCPAVARSSLDAEGSIIDRPKLARLQSSFVAEILTIGGHKQ